MVSMDSFCNYEIFYMPNKSLKTLKFGDNEILLGRGLKALALKNGSVAYILAKKLNGKLVRHTLGHYPDMARDEAEEKAIKYRRLIEDGIHPRDWENEKKVQAKEKQIRQQNNTRTLRQLLVEYETIRVDKNTEGTRKERRWTINRQYGDCLDKPIHEIDYDTVKDHYYNYASQEGKPTQAQKCARYMKAMWNTARRRGWVQDNPFELLQEEVSLTPDNPFLDCLELDEVHHLLDVLDMFLHADIHEKALTKVLSEEQYRSLFKPARQYMTASIGLELFTGVRKREILELEWDRVHIPKYELKNHILHWEAVDPDNPPFFEHIKKKQKDKMGIPITAQMLPFFKAVVEIKLNTDNEENKFLFPSPKLEAPLYNNDAVYELINLFMPKMKRATKVTSTVLRNTFTTMGARLGFRPDEIDLFTGHTTPRSKRHATMWYLAVDAELYRYAFEEINRALAGLLDREIISIDQLLNSDINDIPEDGLFDEAVPELSAREFKKLLDATKAGKEIKLPLEKKKRQTKISVKKATRNRQSS